MRPDIRDILARVSRPDRYVGGEVGSRVKDWERCDVRFCLVFPDVYEIGMSHLGLSILYHLINDRDGMVAERAFTPWADMEAALREKGMKLFSLESYRELGAFDVIGFSLASELSATNVLTTLDLAGIPLRAADRTDAHPLIIAGGPCTSNPGPMAPFFDAIVIGDGEEVTVQLAECIRDTKRDGIGRRDLLDRLGRIRGIAVQGRDGQAQGMNRAIVADLDRAPFPEKPVVAHKATQERLAVEAARGCARGCRFCQAGYIYRPVRQRSEDTATAISCAGLAATGREDFSFLSLSIGDWAPLSATLKGVHEGCPGMPINASLPSMRVESLSDAIIAELGAARAQSFTLAPEAGTERMRRFINKGNVDDDLFASVERVFSAGFSKIKLYFMVGLPTETAADIDGIVTTANRCLDIGKKYHKRPDVTVSTSTFVPKAHTPFQWDRQIGIEETLAIQRECKRRLRRPGLYYRWHDAEQSFLEGVLSRGGAELADAIEAAWRAGARFDGWDECFSLARWREAFAACGIVPETYLEARDRAAPLSWDAFGIGPDPVFLQRERDRAEELAFTPDCTSGACSQCGMCDFDAIKNRMAHVDAPDETPVAPPEQRVTSHESRVTAFRYRLHYTKADRAVFLGSLETLDAIRRGVRAAGFPLCYSEGYHPRARISAGPACPVGVESQDECADIELFEAVAPEQIVQRLQGRLPEGMAVCAAALLPEGAPSIADAIEAVRYEVSGLPVVIDVAGACAAFAQAPSVLAVRIRKGKRREVDIKPLIAELAVRPDGVVGVAVRNQTPALRMGEILTAVFGLNDEALRHVRVRKVAVEWCDTRAE